MNYKKGEGIEDIEGIENFKNLKNLETLTIFIMPSEDWICDIHHVKCAVNHLIVQTLKAIFLVTSHSPQGLPPASQRLAW